MGNRAKYLNKPPLAENRKKIVKVYFGIFFDGTRNNRKASIVGEEYRELVNKKKASKMALGLNEKKAEKEAEKEAKKELNYKATLANKKDCTNVARLEPYFDRYSDDYICRSYIEGIGTDEEGNSNLLDQADGFGDTGVVPKVNKAIKQIRTKINGIRCIGNNTTIELNFELFGFSRGSAAARNFVWKAKEQENNIKNILLPQKVSTIKFKYVGLFDTVSMYGPLGILDKRLNLDAIKDADYVFHICAADDSSSILPLTDITSAKNANVGKEIFIPGDHSDIGGGHPMGIYSYISMDVMHKNANEQRTKMFRSDLIEKAQPIQGASFKKLKKIKDNIEAEANNSESPELCRELFAEHYGYLFEKKHIHCSSNTKKRTIYKDI